MEGFITKIKKDNILFSTPFGIIEGKWKSSNEPELKRYFVELDFPDCIGMDNIQYIDYAESSIVCDNNTIYFKGLVECFEDDALFLRLSKELVMFAVSSGVDLSAFVNNYVCLELHSIDIYDTESV